LALIQGVTIFIFCKHEDGNNSKDSLGAFENPRVVHKCVIEISLQTSKVMVIFLTLPKTFNRTISSKPSKTRFDQQQFKNIYPVFCCYP